MNNSNLKVNNLLSYVLYFVLWGAIFVGFCLIIIDIFPSNQNTEELTKIESLIKNTLPEGSKNVVSLGNDWFTFELDVDNKTRKFLYYRNTKSHTGHEMITELKD